jgi:hypothetical protein
MNFLICEGAPVATAQDTATCVEGWQALTLEQVKNEVTADVFGFDRQSFDYGFQAVIVLFVAGLTVGFIISMIRKVKA